MHQVARSGTLFTALLAAAAIDGCGAKSGLVDQSVSHDCPARPPKCVRAASDPCGAHVLAEAECDAVSHEWRCPLGTREHVRATDQPGVCFPFRDAMTGIAQVAPWGLSSIVRIPTDDGRCLWVVEEVRFEDGTRLRNVAFEPDLTAPFGTCPETSLMPPTAVVTIEGGDDPSILVQLDGGYRIGGETRVIYRLFRVDPDAVFGVSELGGGVARWDPRTERIVVPPLMQPFPWGLDLDLGDAVLVADEGEHAWVWGCAQPGGDFTGGCVLARLDASDHVELWTGRGWADSTRGADGAVLFESGPWRSSVVRSRTRLKHVYAAGFGDEVRVHEAATATGPWSSSKRLRKCNLPEADPNAFCAGPVVHPELVDPTRPGTLPVTYSVGTTGMPVGRLEAYWARLVWAD